MGGSFLRTNYRQTGGEVDMVALGRGILLASAAGGAGTTKPYGGMLVLSMSGSFNGAGAFTDSTYGTMSLYYGGAAFNSGYKFMPLIIQTLSIGTVAVTDLINGTSAPRFILANVTFNGSIWLISAIKQSAAGSCTAASQVDARLLVMGFIVSAP